MATSSPPVSNRNAALVYEQQRLRLEQMVGAAGVRAFMQNLGNQADGVALMLRLVQSGQQAMAGLVDAYMAQSLELQPQGLDTGAYTVSALRSQNPAEVYAQPYAAMTVALQRGEQQDAAIRSGQAKVMKLSATDLQLAQTHAAQDWMQAEPTVTGWRRVADAGACDLCQLAATRVYHTGDLMPIHEHCRCGVEPVVELKPDLSPIDAVVRVAHGDIGPRLLADNWTT